jgi:hypothetical protein
LALKFFGDVRIWRSASQQSSQQVAQKSSKTTFP